MTAPFRMALLDQHERSGFTCGKEPLDRYLKTQATQDVRRRVANCFVAVERTSGTLAGYYTIAAATIALSELPAAVAKKLPRYPTIPAVRIGRLAIDERFQGKGLGGALLADAAARSKTDVAAFALLVDAKDDAGVAFYEHHGFEPFESEPRTLFLPFATAEKAFHTARAKT